MPYVVQGGDGGIKSTGKVLGIQTNQPQNDQKNRKVGNQVKGTASLGSVVNLFTFDNDR